MEYKFPTRFIERYKTIIPDLDNFLLSLQKPLSHSFRINTLKTDKEKVLAELNQTKLEPIPWYEYGFRILDNINLGEHPLHQSGLIYFQDSVSMLPPIVLNPQDDDKILDMTAAPGSKTTQIAQMMHNNGLIVANDVSKKRIGSLINNIERLGILNTVVTNTAGQKLGYFAPAYFDKVLLDAPCSLEGTIRNTPQVLKEWTETRIRRLSKLQKGLINSAFKCLKPEGLLIYSTCTFAPEENEAVLDYLFQKYSNLVCEPISLPNINTRPPILKWSNDKYHEQIKNTIRIYPQDNDTEGFFIAKIRKL